MARWATRIPKTTKARIQFENWIATLGRPPSFATILRLARICELRGWRSENPGSLYEILSSLHPDYVDYYNDVVHELLRREATRERQAQAERRRPISLEEWVASKPPPPARPRLRMLNPSSPVTSLGDADLT